MGHEGKEVVVKLTDDKFYLWPFDFIVSRTMESKKDHHGRGESLLQVIQDAEKASSVTETGSLSVAQANPEVTAILPSQPPKW